MKVSYYQFLSWKLLSMAVCIVLSATNFKAADLNYDWWTTADGLPQNTINSIVQTKDGYLWIATFGGLVRFDGVKFSVFNSINAPQIKSQRITALHEDRAGILWIGTESGEISCFQNGNLLTFDNNKQSEIHSIYADTRGYLWVGDEDGAKRYKLSENACNNGFDISERLEIPMNSSSPRPISTILETSDGNIWLNNFTKDLEKPSRLLRWRENSGIEVFEFSKFAQPGAGFFISDVSISGGVVRFAERSGIYRFDGAEFRKEFAFNEKDATLVNFAKTSDGRILINLSDGIIRLNSAGQWEKTASDLSNKGVKSIFSDSEGNIWLGTNAKGLGRAKPKFIENFDETKGVLNNQTAAVLEDSKGNLWIAGYGLNRLEKDKFVPEKAIPQVYFTALAEKRDGTILIGGYSTFWTRNVDGSTTDLTKEIKAKLGTDAFVIKAVFEDSSGNIWLGFRDNGLLRLDNNGTYQHFTTANGLAGNGIQFITETKDGSIWFAILGGVSYFKDGKFTNLDIANGFLENNFRDIKETADGNIYFGLYGGGLSRLKNGKVKTVSMQNGLFDNVVSRILVDENQDFWMMGNMGVFTVNKSALDKFFDGESTQVFCRSFGTADGMTTAEGNGGSQPAGWLAKDKRLWFPTILGYVAITPPPSERSLPKAVIEEAKINNNPIDLHKAIEIKADEQNLEIFYTGLSFNRSAQLQFRYKLDGYDTDWNEVGTRRTAYYPYPPAGEYVFTVQAASANGIWNETSAKLPLRILPKFYRTWWFFALCLLLLILVGYFLFSIRIYRLNRAKMAQELLSRRLIQVQEEERKRIAADLHDSLSQNLVIIKNRAMISLNERENIENVYEQIEEIAEAANESLTEVREIASNLRPFQIDRLGFTKAVEALVRKINTQHLKIEAEIEKIDGLLKPEMEINLYRILQEVLNNIVKHSEATSALLEIKNDDKKIRIIIADNGKGFDFQQIQNAETADNGSGFGLLGIRERSRILGCVPVIQTSPGKGTTIQLTIANF